MTATLTRTETRDVVKDEPYNAHTPRAALARELTPADHFYVRNHFTQPQLDVRSWRLHLTGAVGRPHEIHWAELCAMPHREVDVVLECAGNGRTLMTPQPPGTPWGDRAVGCARFRGVAFREVVAQAGLASTACEFLFVGADEGAVEGEHRPFERSLPIAAALHRDTLLATHMNDAPLTPEHGAPVRLVVPGWYGVASVKWLVEARALTQPFTGFYQREYSYQHGRGMADGPVTTMRVKSLISSPASGDLFAVGDPVLVCGKAWSGVAPIVRVDITTDGGTTWRPATLSRQTGLWAWTAWAFRFVPTRAGRHRLLARAVDALGNAQPLEGPWNARGYGHNAVSGLDIEAR